MITYQIGPKEIIPISLGMNHTKKKAITMGKIMTDSVFKKLSSIDITSMVRQKGKFWYMPWANAVREVVKNYPSMSWEFTDYQGLPFLETKLGFFVECSVTIDGITRKQMMPVLDFKNQTNMSPLANDINKAQMRALAKAISLHGLGLDLWAGEDLVGWDEPESAQPVSKEQIETSLNEVSAWLEVELNNIALIPNEASVKTLGNRIKEHLKARCTNQHFDNKPLIERLTKTVLGRIEELNNKQQVSK